MQTPLRFPQNALTFRVKRKGVLCEMHLRFWGDKFYPIPGPNFPSNSVTICWKYAGR